MGSTINLQAEERIQLYSLRGRGRGRGRGFFPGRGPPPKPDGQQDVPENDEGPAKGLSASLRDRLGGREAEEKSSQPKRRRDEHDHRYSRQEWNERRFARQHDFEGDGLEEAEPQVYLPPFLSR